MWMDFDLILQVSFVEELMVLPLMLPLLLGYMYTWV